MTMFAVNVVQRDGTCRAVAIPERKLICGRPHVKRPCRGCGELIWVAVAQAKSPLCNDCGPGVRRLPYPGNHCPETLESERQYNGDD